jgi:8-oxo-dGTP pyrophosphatase MutT (NUDIX family)
MEVAMREVRPWRRRSVRRVYDHPLFSLEEQELEAEGGDTRKVIVLEPTDWINVIPLAEDGRVLMVRQWRFGTAAESLEIPGGMVDPGEDLRQAAERELLEETGHRARQWTKLGEVDPNPAIQTNRCGLWLATGLEWVQEPQGDGDEEISVEWVALEKVRELILSGGIRHSLVVAAFYYFDHR